MRIRPRLRVESSGIDWFSISAEWESEGLDLTEGDLARLRAATGRLVRLPQGWVRRDLVSIHDEAAEALADLGIDPDLGQQRVSLWQLAHASPAHLEALERFGADRTALRSIHKLKERVASFAGLPRVPVGGFRGELRPTSATGRLPVPATTSLDSARSWPTTWASARPSGAGGCSRLTTRRRAVPRWRVPASVITQLALEAETRADSGC
jgi:hypothetical protein